MLIGLNSNLDYSVENSTTSSMIVNTSELDETDCGREMNITAYDVDNKQSEQAGTTLTTDFTAEYV